MLHRTLKRDEGEKYGCENQAEWCNNVTQEEEEQPPNDAT